MPKTPSPEDRKILLDFLAENPDLERIELLFPDMHGIFRGKWMPPDGARKLLTRDVRLPISSYALDVWGHDVNETRLALATGDPDGYGVPIMRTLKRLPWTKTPAAQLLMTLETEDGAPCIYDPRQQLSSMVERFAAIGLTAVVAAEMEFYLFRKRKNLGSAPIPPIGSMGTQLYDLDAMDELEDVLREIRRGCEALDLPVDIIIAESGSGQFEINFKHVPDPIAAADYAILFKRLVWGCAQRHDLESTFMAKPYGDDAGSGMHFHVSLINEDGENIFALEDGGKENLHHAIGGLLSTMRELQVIFAPHLNSYRRFQEGSHAPLQPNWGLDNRSASVRVPESQGPAARFEHRISGSDVNPYLALTAILGGALIGLKNKIDPGKPIDEGGAIKQRLYGTWVPAVDAFSRSTAAVDVFGKEYRRVFTACCRAEIQKLSAMVTDVEYQTYLDRI
ncbi:MULTISPECIES: glutamine synthetase family protein [Falsihalocynthiibacter]|uniref:Uncharacterized protein n=1 Tax=Falsihalocynthiibacter arcticus TaxID=1579316 RepID=A0A126UZ55_9RHOB|nr:glutamine synthetase family protein [Falsihalocynthiibacter arcticus]AML50729.1 hypothetical protein RC74_05010 [Falsihalocynthiibacter arcticus]